MWEIIPFSEQTTMSSETFKSGGKLIHKQAGKMPSTTDGKDFSPIPEVFEDDTAVDGKSVTRKSRSLVKEETSGSKNGSSVQTTLGPKSSQGSVPSIPSATTDDQAQQSLSGVSSRKSSQSSQRR